MFPDKSTDSWVFGGDFVATIGLPIVVFRTLDRYIVDIGDSDVGNFRLEDEVDIVMEDRNGIRPPHWKGSKLLSSKGGLKGC